MQPQTLPAVNILSDEIAKRYSFSSLDKESSQSRLLNGLAFLIEKVEHSVLPVIINQIRIQRAFFEHKDCTMV